ncbi:MAG: WhiB family transcriptional regulator [Ilumatobacteraceae bacterium]
MALRRDELNSPGDGHDAMAWQRAAACRGDHAPLFFPPAQFERKDLRVARERKAKAICRHCTVTDACLAYALEFREPHGVWGGLNETERRELLDRGRSDEPVTVRPRGR